jgi:hypothetical protein
VIGVSMMMIFIKYLIISFVSAAALIVISKIIMSAFLRKDLNYYEAHEAIEEQEVLDKMNEYSHSLDKNSQEEH